ncbi:MAG: hypothetical protein F6K47_01740 [Symploca sp. SIO2E6]|nr:hypothetical protein [Symploca sp. SIO2E6]
MFTQFRDRYPQGSLITELSAIEHGQYIVRCLVQVEGKTLVTGLAAAQTVELAEEQARSRALAVLGIDTTTTVMAAKKIPVAPPEAVVPPKSTANLPPELPSPSHEPIQLTQFPLDSSVNDSGSLSFSPASVEDLNHHAPKTPSAEGERKKGWGVDPGTRDAPDAENRNPTPSFVHPPGEEGKTLLNEFSATEAQGSPEESTLPKMDAEMPPSQPNDLPVKSYLQNELETDKSKISLTSGPIDMSEIIARTTVEVKRLGWTNQQGKDYLLQTYGKRSRQLLTDEELLDFLNYLESQPAPEGA